MGCSATLWVERDRLINRPIYVSEYFLIKTIGNGLGSENRLHHNKTSGRDE